MSLWVARTSPRVFDKASWCNFLSPNDDHNNNSSSLWLWTAVGMGVVGIKLCQRAIGLFQFCAAWNEACRKNRDEIRYKSRRFWERQNHRRQQIENSLTILSYGELRRRLSEGSGDKDPPEDSKQEQQLFRQQQECNSGSACCEEPSNHRTRCHHKAQHQQQQFLELEPQCAICLVEFEAGDSISCSKQFFATKDSSAVCRHIFHTACLRAWLMKHTSCPVCRDRMVPDPEPW